MTTTEPQTIRIARFRLRSDMHYGVSWSYEYQTPVDIDWHGADGSVRQGPRAGSWTPAPGSGIADARSRLRAMFPGAKLVETWKVGA